MSEAFTLAPDDLSDIKDQIREDVAISQAYTDSFKDNDREIITISDDTEGIVIRDTRFAIKQTLKTGGLVLLKTINGPQRPRVVHRELEIDPAISLENLSAQNVIQVIQSIKKMGSYCRILVPNKDGKIILPSELTNSHKANIFLDGLIDPLLSKAAESGLLYVENYTKDRRQFGLILPIKFKQTEPLASV